MSFLTLVQARTGSTRLPGKVLLPLGASTVLEVMLERVRAARLVGTVVVATTTEASDDPVVELCRRAGLPCFRGHPTDLLDRHYQAWRSSPADAVVKIPSDCPLIDPVVIDRVLGVYAADPNRYDFVSNLHPQSYPDGNDVEVMSASALERAWREAEKPHEREHTTPYLWDNPERFRVGNVTWERGEDLSRDFRWTLDYEDDYALIRAVYDALSPQGPLFSVGDIVRLLEERPALRALNAARLGDAWYQRHANDLKTFSKEIPL